MLVLDVLRVPRFNAIGMEPLFELLQFKFLFILLVLVDCVGEIGLEIETIVSPHRICLRG